MIWTLYNAKTGAITGTTTDAIRAGSEPSIAGNYDGEHNYVRDRRAVRKPPRPRAPEYMQYVFNYTTAAWELDTAATAQAARLQRNEMFKYVDKISPIWYATMSAQQRLDAQAYRQALLDITQQSDFPLNIQWPRVPDFLRT